MTPKLAEIVSVGTELLLGQIVDTHAPTLGRILASCGIACQRRATLGDNLDRLTQALKESLHRADVVITIGGLGPTQDDLTREAIAQALDEELVHVPEVETTLRRFFAQRNIEYAENNSRQAYRPQSATLIDNPNGTAPGLHCQKNGKTILALPGPTGEFNAMAYGPVKQILEHLNPGAIIHSRTLRIIKMGESLVEDRIKHLLSSENPTVAPYAHTGEVHLRITAHAPTIEEAEAKIAPMEAQLREILEGHVLGVDDESVEEVVLRLLKASRATLAVAESMTGGRLASRITAIPGSSEAFLGGIVSYTEAVKQALLHVPSVLLEKEGPVSEAVAKAMAEGVKTVLNATYGVAITGNAGPTADRGNQPVGLGYVAVAGPNGTTVEETRWRGVRTDIQSRATQVALIALRDALLKAEAP
jgi:nicotinamide-nucleotide amidase